MSKRPPAFFALLALAGLTAREWSLLLHPERWAEAFSGPGDFPPGQVVSAVVGGQPVELANRSAMNPYPLPYDLLFVPLGFIHDPWLRPAVTLLTLGLIAGSVWLLSERGNRGNWPAALSLPVLLLILGPHLPSVLGMFGLCLAAWAQPRRRWGLMGLGLMLGLIRPPNAVPLLAVLCYCSWGEWRGLGRAAAVAALALLPLTVWAFAVDAHWVADFVANLASTMYAGLPLLAISYAGGSGLLALLALTTIGSLLLVRDARGRPLDPDRAALVISLGILPSKLSGAYSGIYAVPALARLGLRKRLRWTPWLASGAVWVLELALFPSVFAGGGEPPAWESVVAYWLVFAAWPLAIGSASAPGREAEPSPARTLAPPTTAEKLSPG